MTPRPAPTPPRPELVRRPQGPFGWLDARLLREGWLAELGPDATAVLVLLALAADRRGASFYGRERMARELKLTRRDLDQALERLLERGLVAHRPWRAGQPDGVWQLLPLPERAIHPPCPPRGGAPQSIAELLGYLGLPQTTGPTAE